MRILFVALIAVGCGNNRNSGGGDASIDGTPGDACVGFQCRVVDCTSKGMPPTSRLQGDIPKIAITTGSCDALECLVRRLGVSDGEFSTDGGTGNIHLYNGNGASQLSNGTNLAPATALWSDLNKLKTYDMVLM